MITPIYAKQYEHTQNSIRKDQQRIIQAKQDINRILNTQTITIKNKFQHSIQKIKEETGDNIIQLAKIYTLCITEIKNIDEPAMIQLSNLYRDLENIEYYQYQYLITPSPYYKTEILKLIRPYIPEIKKLIINCEELFAEEKDEFESMLPKI